MPCLDDDLPSLFVPGEAVPPQSIGLARDDPLYLGTQVLSKVPERALRLRSTEVTTAGQTRD